MIRVAILVEGQTEEEFVKRVLASHLHQKGVFVTGHNLGGGVSVHKMAGEMRAFCRSYDVVTSLVDYYGFKGKKEATVEELEQRICTEVGDKVPRGGSCKIYPYVQRHEFEGLLFSNVEKFQKIPSVTPTTIQRLKRIRGRFATPEDINDSDASAPSKRVKKVIPTYPKVVDGANLAEWITLARIRQECKRFDAWVACLEKLGQEAVEQGGAARLGGYQPGPSGNTP